MLVLLLPSLPQPLGELFGDRLGGLFFEACLEFWFLFGAVFVCVFFVIGDEPRPVDTAASKLCVLWVFLCSLTGVFAGVLVGVTFGVSVVGVFTLLPFVIAFQS